MSVHGDRSGPFWPWSVRAAVVAVPVILVCLLLLLSLTRAAADWPDDSNEGTLLAGILLLSLLPVLLLLLGALAGGGGSVEAFGVAIRFAETSRARQEVTVPPRLGLQPGMTLNDSSTAQILDVLGEATRSDVAVLDLEEGTAWWETRLAVLCAGAARLGRPEAIAFVATTGGTRQVFKGWAPPVDLLECLLTMRPDLRIAYERARAIFRQWELAVPPEPSAPPGVPPVLPFPVGLDTGVQWAVFPQGATVASRLAAEQIFALQLGQLEDAGAHGVVTAARLVELFDPVLRTHAVDLDSADGQPSWAQAVLVTTDPFVAVTNGPRYAGLLRRDAALNDVLRALLDGQGG